MLVDLGSTHNSMFEIFAISFGHSIGTMDPYRILSPIAQIFS